MQGTKHTKLNSERPAVAFFKKILPWVVCVGILGYLFSQFSPREILGVLRTANLTQLIGYSLAYFLMVMVVDAFAIKHFLTRFATEASLRDVFLVRGVSYLMMIINYAAAQGVFAIYFKKTHNASVSKTLGTLFFLSLADIILVFTSAFVALSFSNVNFHGFELRPIAYKAVPLIYLGYAGWAFFWRNTQKPFFQKWRQLRLIKWLLDHDVFHIFREAKFKDYAELFCFRAPLLVVIIAGLNFGLMAFNAEIGWSWVYLYNPIIMFITALPITPAGLGTGQYLTIEFYKNLVINNASGSSGFSAEHLLFASSLIWGMLNQIYKALFGLICLSRVSKSLFTGNEE